MTKTKKSIKIYRNIYIKKNINKNDKNTITKTNKQKIIESQNNNKYYNINIKII